MCGLAGYIDFNKRTKDNVLREMIASILHRGPDDNGTVFYDTIPAKIGLGHVRLSIIDTSITGHQPMTYNDICVVYNGEVYNFGEIKNELVKAGHCFKSTSDTEVILHSYEMWGEEFVHRLIGMFVIVLFDINKRKILIFRDRAGIKPVYYYWKDGLFLFGSELKAFFKHPDFIKDIDEAALLLYFKFGYIPSPYSIFQNTYKINPGEILSLTLDDSTVTTRRYWNVIDYYFKPKLDISYQEAKDHLHTLLISAVNYRMISDVPVGVFLSGGFDSSTVAAILQTGRNEKIKTFTIGFEEGNNEAPFASKIASFLGTDHTEYTCHKKEAQDITLTLPYYYDEPFADSSAIPTILVSKLAREKVTVALSADAGDEVFCGYLNYPQLYSNLKLRDHIPDFFLSPGILSVLKTLSFSFPARRQELIHKISSLGKTRQMDTLLRNSQLYKFSNSFPDHLLDNILFRCPKDLPTPFDKHFDGFQDQNEIPMGIDYEMYLPNDILTKVDRATMSVSLEGREPLLDHRIVEFAAQMPFRYKYDGKTGKRILKDINSEYIPGFLMQRPKTGFSLPIYQWLNTDLSYLLDEYLNKRQIEKSSFFNSEFVFAQVKLFKSHRFYYKPLIWRLLMFQMWYAKWM